MTCVWASLLSDQSEENTSHQSESLHKQVSTQQHVSTQQQLRNTSFMFLLLFVCPVLKHQLLKNKLSKDNLHETTAAASDVTVCAIQKRMLPFKAEPLFR